MSLRIVEEEMDPEIKELIEKGFDKTKVLKVSLPKPGAVVQRNVDALLTGFKYVVKPMRLTIDYPYKAVEYPEGYRGMFRVDDNKCVGCSLCDVVCPADAIRLVLKDKKKVPVINWGRCIFCYFCVDICPVEAFETTKYHDAVFTRFEDMLTTLEEFTKRPEDYVPMRKIGKRYKVVIDEYRGLRYEPVG
ncbi:MAG: 4Fe-4S dicluster domain-containing protein [Desulfurococcales archaeon]|jgi:NADH-quinone oxidoreductase subunit I|nr:NADH-quinone oxidoreductase subunit I [Desulfurococcaceae archaeon]NAZ14275.1 4Fe-4S dicluster domain-containing protein [Desulfurococcales archaeon]